MNADEVIEKLKSVDPEKLSKRLEEIKRFYDDAVKIDWHKAEEIRFTYTSGSGV